MCLQFVGGAFEASHRPANINSIIDQTCCESRRRRKKAKRKKFPHMDFTAKLISLFHPDDDSDERKTIFSPLIFHVFRLFWRKRKILFGRYKKWKTILRNGKLFSLSLFHRGRFVTSSHTSRTTLRRLSSRNERFHRRMGECEMFYQT